MANAIPYVQGIRSLNDYYDAYLVDLWGVIYDDEHVCRGVYNVLSQLRKTDKKIIFLSNSPHRSSEVQKKLERLGIKRQLYNGILTAGEIIYHEMSSRVDPFFENLRNKCFHLGPEKNWKSFADLDYISVPNIDEASFIFVTGTFGEQDSLEKYDPFFKMCRSRRLPMICACPDSFVLKNGVPYIAAGAIAAQYQKIGGTVFWRGKPDPNVYLYCLEGLKVEKSRVAMIGDNIQTDILGANLAEIDALFIAGGVHSKELGIRPGQQPDSDRISSFLKQYQCQAKAVLPAFNW